MKEVLGVKLLIESSDGSAKPGMPADGEILVRGKFGQGRSGFFEHVIERRPATCGDSGSTGL